MVCCALIALPIAVILWLSRAGRRGRVGDDPLAWRLDGRTDAAPLVKGPDGTAFSLAARVKSVGFALAGLAVLLRREHNAWIHLAATLLVAAAGFALGIAASDWRWLAAAVLWVWFAEALNTALEHLCDAVSGGKPDPSIRIAKDIAAGAVLISALGAALLGALTLLPYLAQTGPDGGWCGAVP